MRTIAWGKRCAIFAVGLMLVAGGGCDDDDTPAADRGGTGGSSGAGGNTGTGTATTTLNDGRVAAVMIEANAGEIHAGELAKSRTTNASVQEFATMMVTEHTASTTRIQQLLEQKRMQTEDSAFRQNLGAQATQTMNTLWSAAAERFDVVYLDSQITMHNMVLQLLDSRMLPATQDNDLKSELTATRERVMSHLTHAQQLRATLGSGGGTTGGNGTGTGTGTGGTGAFGASPTGAAMKPTGRGSGATADDRAVDEGGSVAAGSP